jgi:hypothetical protein
MTTLRELISELQELDAKYAEHHKDTDFYIYLSTGFGDEVPLDDIDSVLCPLMSKDGKYTGKKACHIVLCASVSMPEKKKKKVRKYDYPRTHSQTARNRG